MKFRMLLTLLLCSTFFVLFPGCGEKAEKKTDSPTEVFQKIFAAMKRADFDAVEKFVSEDFKWENEEVDAELRHSEAKKREFVEALAKVKIEYVSEKIDGDLAAVKVVISNGGEKHDESFGFKRIGGAWKMLGVREGSVVVKQLSLKGAQPDAVVREYIGNHYLRVSVMLCGGAKKRELAATAEMKNGDGANAIYDFWEKEIQELAADGGRGSKEPKDESSSAIGCLDLSECTDAVELETIDGDLAVVKVKRIMNGYRRKDRMYLQKIDGEWKIVWKYEYDRAKAARERH